MVVVPRILVNRWYMSPTPLGEGVCNVSRSVATVDTFLVALMKVGSFCSTRSIATVRPAPGAESRW
jgi:hypothetical protein